MALNTEAKPRTIYERYRRRFGIEASYRLLHRARARTATRNYVVRLLLFGGSLLVENEWLWTKYDRLATMRRGRGGRVVHDGLLRFERFLAIIVHVVNHAFAFILEVAVDAPAPRRKRVTNASSGGRGKY